MTRPDGGDDVVVVGGGPAGAFTALLLARRGWRVRLFDRDHFPRAKLCGDTLNPGALGVLARHLDLTPLAVLAQPIRGMRISGPGGVQVRGTYPDGVAGLSITRAVFDEWLLRRAARDGVMVEEGAAAYDVVTASGQVAGVRVRTANGGAAHAASLVVAADGRRSTLAARLGLSQVPRQPRRWALGAYMDGVGGVQPGFGEMHVRAGRYLGIAPVPGGLTNVCLVAPYEAVRLAMHDAGAAILHVARTDTVTAGRFAGARIATAPVVLGPMAMDVTVPGVPGLLLAGDAAGFIDPMTGDGMRLALAGAEIAAAVGHDVLSGRLTAGEAPRALARRRRAAFAGKWRFNRAVRGLVGSGGLHGAALAARIWPRLFDTIVCYAGDVGAARHPGVPCLSP